MPRALAQRRHLAVEGGQGLTAAEGERLPDQPVLHKQAFDGCGGHILSPGRDDEFLLTVDHAKEPICVECADVAGVQPAICTEQASRRLRRPEIPGEVTGPRTRISPSSAILSSMPGNGRPTVPSRNASGVFAVTAPVVSVISYTSRIFMPRPVPFENGIRLVTCGSSGYQAARVYLLIRPPRAGFRWIRSR